MNRKKISRLNLSLKSKEQKPASHEKLQHLNKKNQPIKGSTASEINRKFYTQIKKRG